MRRIRDEGHTSAMGLLTGEVARRSGVNVQTVLFYERSGLIAPRGRRKSGYREFDPDVANRIVFVKNAQKLGFTLKEISDLLTLTDTSNTTCRDICDKAELKLKMIDDKIDNLKAVRTALHQLMKQCQSTDRPATECAIIDALQQSGSSPKKKKKSHRP